MKKLSDRADIIGIIASVLTILSVLAGMFVVNESIKNVTLQVSNDIQTATGDINSNIQNAMTAINKNEVSVSIEAGPTINDLQNNKPEQELLSEALLYVDAGRYDQAIAIYQNLIDKNATAKLNLGYMYAKGYGVIQDSSKASNYYRESYEEGLALGLHNYVSINLSAPFAYEETLEALKYGYAKGNETAIQYLSLCYYGELKDTTMDEHKALAGEFLQYDTEKQLSKLRELADGSNTEVIYLPEDQRPSNTEFTTYQRKDAQSVKKVVAGYTLRSDAQTQEKVVVPVYAADISYAYIKTNVCFYMSEYFLADTLERP
jgi:tetratricopeptide (TPR) repeat protein